MFKSIRSTRRAVLAAAAIAALSAAQSASAQLFWDANGVAPVDGGTGVWDNGITANWAVDAGGSSYVTWNNGAPSDAIFNASAGNVTIDSSSNVTATSLLFNVTGYTLGGTGSLTLSGAGTIGVTTAGDVATVSVPLAGSVGFTKVGAGGVALGATNIYTGTTSVTGGTLALTIDGAIPAGNGMSIAGGILAAGSINTSVTGLSLNNGTITGTGAIATTGTVSHTGATAVSMAGLSQIGLPTSFTSAPTFDVAAGGTGTVTLPINASGLTLTKAGGGTLAFTGTTSNTFSKLLVNNSTVQITTDRNLGAVPGATTADAVTLDGGAIRVTSNVWGGAGASPAARGWTITSNNGTLDVSQTSGVPTIAFNINGVGQLTKTGVSTVHSAGSHGFNGLVVELGRWNVYNSNAAGAGPITLAARLNFGSISTGTANLGIGGSAPTTVALANPIILSTANGGTNSIEIVSNGTLQLDGKISGAGGFSRGLVASTPGNLIITNPANDYAGDTILLQGTTRLGASEVIPDTSTVQVNSRLLIQGNTETLGALKSTVSGGTVDLGAGGGALIVGANNTATLAFGGHLDGTGNITKIGTGVQTFSNPSNTFTGNVAVNGGTLQVNVDSNLGNAANALAFDGGMLRVNDSAFTTTARNITANSSGGGIDTNGFDITHTGTITGAGTFKKSGVGKLTVNNVRAGGVEVSGGTLTVVAGRNTANTSQVNSVSVTGGAGLDLNDQDLIADTSGTTLANLQSLLASGYNGNLWTGPGINSTAAATNNAIPGAHQTALGYGDNGVLGYAGTYSGVPIAPTSLIVRYTYSGDANLDGTVDTIDFNLLAANFSQPGRVWTDGDFDFNGVVDSIDFNLLASNFSQVLPGDAGSSIGVLVPEPGSLAVVGAAVGGLLARRRRSRL